MTIATVLLILVLANPVAFAAQHIVGGSSGWTNFGTDYSTWAAGETFNVGDTLVFNYDSTTHKVAQVSQTDYNGCSSSNAVQTYGDGATTITLSNSGPLYFICPTSGHCGGGMKLAINVVAANSTTPSPTTPVTSPSTPTTTPASPTTGSSTPATGTPPATRSPASSNGAVGDNKRSLMIGSLALGTVVAALMG